MSGKSTLLRAIGLNAVLAQAGGPVCATAMRLPALDVRSSIRVRDSLERGVSHFMAELERLKGVVDAADAPLGARVLFLLDEVLHGTNTAERRIAARRVLEHLLAAGAIGAITTHDLELLDGSLEGVAVPVHFRETIEEGEGGGMSFDYTLRPGLATSTNALALMRLVGLD
jgi:DNA mismatch repair ATPase MutS